MPSTNNVDENIDWDRLLSCPNITSRRKRRQRPRANAYVDEEDCVVPRVRVIRC